MAYEQVAGPLGPERGDHQAAIVASVVANAMRPKGARALSPADFLPRWTTEPAGGEQTEEDHLRLARRLNRAMGGTETEGGDRHGDAGGSADQGRG